MNRYQRGWLKDLRNPDSKQARGAFKKVADEQGQEPELIGFCCLGLYADSFIVGTGEGNWEYSDGLSVREYNLEGCSSTSLPDEHRLLLGLTDTDTAVLAMLNDDYKFGFLDIADVLEHVFLDGSIDVATAAKEIFIGQGLEFHNHDKN